MAFMLFITIVITLKFTKNQFKMIVVQIQAILLIYTLQLFHNFRLAQLFLFLGTHLPASKAKGLFILIQKFQVMLIMIVYEAFILVGREKQAY